MSKMMLVLSVLAGCYTSAPPPIQSVAVAPRVEGLPRHAWSEVYSNGSSGFVRAMASDAAGTTYIVGSHDRRLDLAGVAVDNHGRADGYVVAIAADGAPRWARAIGGDGYDEARAVASNGTSIVVGGATHSWDPKIGSAKFGVRYENAPYVAAFGADGATLWAHQLSGGGRVEGVAMAPGGRDVFATGYDLVRSTCANGSVIAARIAPDGEARWTLCGSPGVSGSAQRIAVDHRGDAVVCGEYHTWLQLGNTSTKIDPGFPSHDLTNTVFVTKLDGRTGRVLWATKSTGGSRCRAIAIDASGEIAVGGDHGGMQLGDFEIPRETYGAGFVARLGSDGTPRGLIHIGDPDAHNAVGGLAYTDAGELVVAGHVGAGANLGGPKLKGPFLAGFDRSHRESWTKRFHNDYAVVGVGGLTRSPDGALAIAGDLYASQDEPRTIDLGGGARGGDVSHDRDQWYDLYVARYTR